MLSYAFACAAGRVVDPLLRLLNRGLQLLAVTSIVSSVDRRALKSPQASLKCDARLWLKHKQKDRAAPLAPLSLVDTLGSTQHHCHGCAVGSLVTRASGCRG